MIVEVEGFLVTQVIEKEVSRPDHVQLTETWKEGVKKTLTVPGEVFMNSSGRRLYSCLYLSFTFNSVTEDVIEIVSPFIWHSLQRSHLTSLITDKEGYPSLGIRFFRLSLIINEIFPSLIDYWLTKDTRQKEFISLITKLVYFVLIK